MMTVREMIVSGYVGAEDPVGQIDPFLRHLHGKFVDELSEADKALYEYTSIAGLGDLWLAYWDDLSLELWFMAESEVDHTRRVRIAVSTPPEGGPKKLLPALYLLSSIMETC
jgi:hypothetical protein